MIEQVYNRYYDTGGNYHWVGIYSGDHILRKGEEMSKSIDISSAINQFHVRTVQLVELTDECIEKIVNKIAEVSEREHGEWIELYENNYKCSACGDWWETIEGTPQDNGMGYCPHCGAKMEGAEE